MSQAKVRSATARVTQSSKTEHELVISLFPVPASRPRVTKWGTYYTGTYKQWMKEADETIPAAETTLEGNLHVDLLLVCHKPRTTKRLNPRGDIDNHIKAVFDALTKKGYWKDDDQVVSVKALKRWPIAERNEEPYIYVRITQV